MSDVLTPLGEPALRNCATPIAHTLAKRRGRHRAITPGDDEVRGRILRHRSAAPFRAD